MILSQKSVSLVTTNYQFEVYSLSNCLKSKKHTNQNTYQADKILSNNYST